ncbi:MAG: pyridoxine 5'-phosphate synthase [Planctomycetes bacterium]|nr:pyridoxine 5'-phosphate synthase [Planctomycetota bacterium]
MPRLHVNIDHVATVRQARHSSLPDPVFAAGLCELAGANGITAHLREDRRHIQDRDVRLLREMINTLFNLEMAYTPEMIAMAHEIRPDQVCLVPEKRQELTTEGGLDLSSQPESFADDIASLQSSGIDVSLFIDPNPNSIEAAAKSGANFIELHTGAYANATAKNRDNELQRLTVSAIYANEMGLRVNAGHGLDYDNVMAVAQIPHIEELNIGYSIIGRAVYVGLDQAVREMQDRILAAAPPEDI